MIKAVRGTRDLLPPETALWNHVEGVVRDVFRTYNFQEIRTPIFEKTELFSRGVGQETDIVAKEMYTWWEGQAPEIILARSWVKQYRDKYDHIEPDVLLRDRQRADFVGHKDGNQTIIGIAYEPTVPTLIQLRSLLSSWTDPTALPNLAIGVPEEKAEFTRGLMSGIDVQPIKIPDGYEPPNSLTLRPENTAGVVRAYIENRLESRGLNKFYYIGPQFRRERPQKGRYRQFYQIGAEVIGPATSGSESPARDAELLEMLATLLDRLGIKNWNLQLNSVGSSSDRVRYNDALRTALEPVKNKMCGDCQRRAVTNPLRVLDCKVPEDQPIIETLPRIYDYLDDASKKHFEEVKAILESVGVPFEINHRLVRGLDYYTRTAFEFTHGALGAQNAILGGGRYDGLAEILGSPQPAPGIGFAIGEDRLILALQEAAGDVQLKPDVYIAPLGAGMNRQAGKLARELRRQGIVAELGDENFRLKKSFETADKMGSRYILILGENEVKSDIFAVKNLKSGEQVSVPRSQLATYLRAS